MKKHFWRILLVLMGIFLVVGCSSSEDTPTADNGAEHNDDHDMEGMDHDMEGMDHDMDHVHVEPPDEYASLENPFAGDADAVAEGKVIFDTNCATCHGPEGLGDGPAAIGLDPQPATLADSQMMNTLSDGYLFWRVSEGGIMEPFNSAMPVWKTILSEDQRWQVISYVRTLAE